MSRRPLGHDATMGLRVTRTEVGVTLSGAVDVETWGDLSVALDRVVRRPRGNRIVVDLADLSFIDAHGLRPLAEAAGSLPPSMRRSVNHTPPQIARILRLPGRPGRFERVNDAA